jgi:ubiquinone/menaquinone biosynthesis C-methylase UbiE
VDRKAPLILQRSRLARVADGVDATSAEWRAYASRDPLFVAASWEGMEDGGWDEDAFYSLGESDWRDFSARWRDYEPGLGGTVLEMGCGPGRITRQLVPAFERVIACDVSPDMLAIVERVAPAAERRMVEGTTLPAEDDSVDAVFTCHVLQHLDSMEVVSGYFAEMARVLRPGGTVMAHLLMGSESRLGRSYHDARLALNRRLLARGRYSYRAQMRYYEAPEVRAELSSAGFTDIELREFALASNGDPHAFWFGRA